MEPNRFWCATGKCVGSSIHCKYQLVENRPYAYADGSPLQAVVRKPADRPAVAAAPNRDFATIQHWWMILNSNKTKVFVSRSRGWIIKTLLKLQCSAPCIFSYNMKATMCQQCCKPGSYKIYKFIVGRLYVLLRRAHCSHHMATYNTEQQIRERVTNYSKSL